jgi:hypothetical protein
MHLSAPCFRAPCVNVRGRLATRVVVVPRQRSLPAVGFFQNQPKKSKKKVAAVVHPLCAKHSRVAQREPLARVHPSPPPARRSGDFGPRPAWLYLRPPRGDKDSDTGLPALDRSRASRGGKDERAHNSRARPP